MAPEPEIHAASIVVRGSFTPALFHPSWLASHGLIAEGEASAAKVEIVHPKAAVFSTEWLQLRVTEDRFQVSTMLSPYFEILRDLAAGVFRLLPQTPFNAIGLNHAFHFHLPSEDVWHTVGHRLAPKEAWNEVLRSPGTLSLSIQAQRDDDLPGYIRVQVEPSAKVTYGIFVDVNDHHQLAKDDQDAHTDTKEIIGVLASSWESCSARADRIVSAVLRLGGIQ